MGADTAGRKLGIGLRLAAKAVQQRAAEAIASPSAPPPARSKASPAFTATQAVAQAPKIAKGLARGAKRFTEALWGPMAHTGGVLFLEITGLFFALFAAFFGQNVYNFRHDYARGSEHTHFLVYAALTVLFAWFTVTSFHKARQKERKNRARRAGMLKP